MDKENQKMNEEHDNLYVMAQFEIAISVCSRQLPLQEKTIALIKTGEAFLAEFKKVEKERNKLRWTIEKLKGE